MKKIVVTGAAGLVGQNLIPLLIQKGYSVVGIDKNNNNLNLLKKLNPKVEIIHADMSKPGFWELNFDRAYAIVQLQAQIAAKTKEPFEKNNITAVKNVVKACKKHKIKNLVHLSSSVVISVADDDYTRTKTVGEEIVKKSKIPCTILRPPLMYGCFDVKHLGWIAKLMEKSPVIPIPGKGDFIRQPLYVKDMCKIILKCIERGPTNKIHNVIGLERIKYIELLRKIANKNNMSRIFLKMPTSLFGIMMNVYAFITHKPAFTEDQMKALIAGDDFPVEDWEKEFGVKYTTFEKGITETVKSLCYKYRKEMISPH